MKFLSVVSSGGRTRKAARQHCLSASPEVRKNTCDCERRADGHALSARLRTPMVGPYGFQNPCEGMRNARLKREEAFSHAMIIVSSAMVSSS